MTDTITGSGSGPEKYLRVNVTKNTKGYSYEKTASVRWSGTIDDGAAELEDLLREGDRIALENIAQLEAENGGQA